MRVVPQVALVETGKIVADVALRGRDPGPGANANHAGSVSLNKKLQVRGRGIRMPVVICNCLVAVCSFASML